MNRDARDKHHQHNGNPVHRMLNNAPVNERHADAPLLRAFWTIFESAPRIAKPSATISTTVIQFAGFQEIIVGLSMFQLKHAAGQASMFFGLQNHARDTGGMLRFGVREREDITPFRFILAPPAFAVILSIRCWIFIGHRGRLPTLEFFLEILDLLPNPEFFDSRLIASAAFCDPRFDCPDPVTYRLL